METTKTLPVNRPLTAIHSHECAHKPRSEFLYPGKPVNIAPLIDIEISYDQEDGEYSTHFNFYYRNERLGRNYHFDKNNQIDLRATCGRMITHMATTYADNSRTRPIRTLIEIANVPLSFAN